jgi:CobQ-like glutamine amidotransferase family enzyme
MSTYGDRGNILVLQKRCQWRNIGVTILPIDNSTDVSLLSGVDLLFGGGAQDREQELVMRDLRGKKGDEIRRLIENNIPALFVCGSPQLLGLYYEPSPHKRIKGLSIFAMKSVHPDIFKNRLIGNVAAKIINPEALSGQTIVGFENHGGRTYLEKNAMPFAAVLSGNGNNGEDKTEGVVYKNAIGCYFHGPILPKNPALADYLLSKALLVKYGFPVALQKLDDALEQKAHDFMLHKLDS